METAEEFVRTFLRGALTHQRAVSLIEADRAAVALAVIAECREWLTKGGFYDHVLDIPERMLSAIESKYTKAGGGT